MKEKIYVDRLFADYELTPELKDFKEEIAVNLKERVEALVSTGLDEEQAFGKAAAELGDITAIADEVGKRKRNETIGQMYMRAKVPFTKRTAAGLTAASGLLLLAAGIALIAFFEASDIVWPYYTAVILLASACGLYTYFGLTQETAARYAMKHGRALTYGIVCSAGFLGAGFASVSFLLGGLDMSAALGIKTALILPSACVLIFLLFTEPKRQKPWLKAIVERETENSVKFHMDIVNPAKAAKFGVISGGLWVLAVAVFITLGLLTGWQFAWLVFLFALAVQVFMSAMIFEKNK